jgi:hypothetical protein
LKDYIYIYFRFPQPTYSWLRPCHHGTQPFILVPSVSDFFFPFFFFFN